MRVRRSLELILSTIIAVIIYERASIKLCEALFYGTVVWTSLPLHNEEPQLRHNVQVFNTINDILKIAIYIVWNIANVVPQNSGATT